MRARIGMPIVVMGPIANGSTEHAALITRVWFPHQDTKNGSTTVNATMFPDGGGDAQFQNQIDLYDNREKALEAGVTRRSAYWAGQL